MYTRNEIEQAIKDNAIDRNRFNEVSKGHWQGIIHQIEVAFVDKSEDYRSDIHWANMGNYHKNMSVQYFSLPNDKWDWFRLLPQILPEPEKPVWVLFEDSVAYEPKYWLYEAFLPELITVLETASLDDYYIVSKDCRWLFSLNHHDVLSCVGDGFDDTALASLEL